MKKKIALALLVISAGFSSCNPGTNKGTGPGQGTTAPTATGDSLLDKNSSTESSGNTKEGSTGGQE